MTHPELLELYEVDRPPRLGHPCWVLANMVGGLDGSASVGGRVGELSAGFDPILFRHLRTIAHVVLVGAETVRTERYGPIVLPDAQREERLATGRTSAPRIAIVSSSLEFDWSIPLFADAADDCRPLIITGASTDPAALAEAEGHADVMLAGNGKVDLGAALSGLANLGLPTVLCEGGPHLLGELVAGGHLDELCLTIAPVMGGDALPVAVSPVDSGISRFALRHLAADDDVLFLRYELVP